MPITRSGDSLISAVIARATLSEHVEKVVVAMTSNPSDDSLERAVRKLGVKIFRGSELDVLGRYFECHLRHPSQFVVRVTADDPFKDPREIDALILRASTKDADYVANNFSENLPEGLDVEVISARGLRLSHALGIQAYEREHVTQWIRNNGSKLGLRVESYSQLNDWPTARLTVDTKDDLDLACEIYEELGNDIRHSSDDLRELLGRRTDLVNRSIMILPRNAGLTKSKDWSKKH